MLKIFCLKFRRGMCTKTDAWNSEIVITHGVGMSTGVAWPKVDQIREYVHLKKEAWAQGGINMQLNAQDAQHRHLLPQDPNAQDRPSMAGGREYTTLFSLPAVLFDRSRSQQYQKMNMCTPSKSCRDS